MTTEAPSHVQAPAGWSRPARLTADLTLGLLAWAMAGLALALMGLFHWWLVLPLSLGLWYWSRRYLPPADKGFDRWWIAVLGLALAVAAFNVAFPAEHVFTGRDNGTYLATAGWLAESGRLTVDVGEGPLGEQAGLHYLVPGFYDIDLDRVLEPQFMHAFPAMLGTLIDIGGLQAAFFLGPLVSAMSLLVVFALARRFARPQFALLSVIAFGAGLVFVYYARATFSEPLMVLFVTAGIWLVGVVEDRLDPGLAWLAGALLGAATLVRLDGIVLLPPVTAYLLVRGTLVPESARALQRVRTAMFLVALIGLGESLLISPPYVLDRRAQVVPVLVALLAVLIAHRVLERRIPLLANWIRSNRGKVLGVCVGTLLVFVTYGSLLRPFVTESTSSPYAIESIQEREGLEVGSDRNFSEQSVWWIAWYQGWVFLALGVVGCVALMIEISQNRGTGSRNWLILVVLISFSALYFWKPSINPDHIWVMRRFLTVVIPLGSVVASVGADRLTQLARRVLDIPATQWAVGAGMALALTVPASMATYQVWDLAEFSSMADDFVEACGEIGPNAHVLFLDDESGDLGHRFAQSFRSYCGLPSAWGGAGLTTAQLHTLAGEVAADGGHLVTISDRQTGTPFLEDPYRALERTLTSRPDELVTIDLSMAWTSLTGDG